MSFGYKQTPSIFNLYPDIGITKDVLKATGGSPELTTLVNKLAEAYFIVFYLQAYSKYSRV